MRKQNRRAKTRKPIIFLVLFAVILIGFVVFGFFVPVSMNVEQANPYIYQYADVSKKDLQVTLSTLFGRTFESTDYELSHTDEDMIRVTRGKLWKDFNIARIRQDKVEAVYDADAYEGDSFDRSAVKINLVYTDGTKTPIESYEFNEPSQIFTDEPMEFDVSTVYGDTHLAIVPIPITEMEAEYTGNVHLFETIDPEQVEVNLIYEDGMKKRLDAFDVEDPGEIEGETKTVIHTDYGDADLVIHPVAVDKVEAVYDGYVYETEPFSKDAIHVVATMVDGYSVEVTDFDCGQEKEITDETDINIKTDYGEAKCHIIPVRITSISSDAGTVVAGGQVAIHKIYFQYEDESVKEISAHEVKFTDDTASQVLQEGNNIFKFEYKGKEYELNIPAVNEAFAGP